MRRRSPKKGKAFRQGEVEDEIESRKKLDEQKEKMQKELREIEKFSCVPKEAQESLKSNLQQQLQEQKESTAAEEKIRKLREDV